MDADLGAGEERVVSGVGTVLRMSAHRPDGAVPVERGPVRWFADASFHLALRRTVIPLLRTYPSIDVWHPACGSGEDAYATAIVLREEGLDGRFRVYATDARARAVARGASGDYPLAPLRASNEAYLDGGGAADLDDYYTASGEGRAVMKPELRRRVSFFQHDASFEASFNEFHLIVCRDALASDSEWTKARVLSLLHASLCRFGVLAVGRAEATSASLHTDSYEEIGRGEWLYRRVR
jgi:chemotaxis protein methyltransferase CheR